MGDVHAHALPSSGTQSHARCPAVRPGAEVRTDHRCFLETLAERVARVTASAAARRQLHRALDELLADHDFDRHRAGVISARSTAMAWRCDR